jgi:hypothetical protein
MPVLERPCRICSKPFIANKYAGNRQAVCGDAGCKKTAKKLAQAHWCARNPDYFRGPENSCRVLQWRRENPDWRQRQAAGRSARAAKSSSQTESCNTPGAQPGRLQDSVPDSQSVLLVGLASVVSGSVLQDEVQSFFQECLRRGGDLLRPNAGVAPFFDFNPSTSTPTHGKIPDRSRADPPLACAL